MQTQFGFVENQQRRQVCLRLQQQRDEGDGPQNPIGCLVRAEDPVAPTFAPAEPQLVLLRLEQEVSEERQDLPHDLDDSSIV